MAAGCLDSVRSSVHSVSDDVKGYSTLVASAFAGITLIALLVFGHAALFNACNLNTSVSMNVAMSVVQWTAVATSSAIVIALIATAINYCTQRSTD